MPSRARLMASSATRWVRWRTKVKAHVLALICPFTACCGRCGSPLAPSWQAPRACKRRKAVRYTSRTTPHVTYVTRQVGPRARILYAVQGRISDTLFSGKTTQAAWRSKPSWYAISTEDRTISPELERFMADRMKAKTIEVKASHLSLISHPNEITNLILNTSSAVTFQACGVSARPLRFASPHRSMQPCRCSKRIYLVIE
jgi:pimeloyl-ACP methyl ester carboxylesterase